MARSTSAPGPSLTPDPRSRSARETLGQSSSPLLVSRDRDAGASRLVRGESRSGPRSEPATRDNDGDDRTAHSPRGRPPGRCRVPARARWSPRVGRRPSPGRRRPLRTPSCPTTGARRATPIARPRRSPESPWLPASTVSPRESRQARPSGLCPSDVGDPRSRRRRESATDEGSPEAGATVPDRQARAPFRFGRFPARETADGLGGPTRPRPGSRRSCDRGRAARTARPRRGDAGRLSPTTVPDGEDTTDFGLVHEFVGLGDPGRADRLATSVRPGKGGAFRGGARVALPAVAEPATEARGVEEAAEVVFAFSWATVGGQGALTAPRSRPTSSRRRAGPPCWTAAGAGRRAPGRSG